MPWNWQLKDWPHFIFDERCVLDQERKFLQGAGGVFAVFKYLDLEKKQQFIIEILSAEGQKSAEIEGEILERESLQSSIKKHFGLASDGKKTPPKELGMGNLMWSMYETYNKPLTHEMLWKWYQLLFQSSDGYRTHPEPMQIVSGRLDKTRIYFEAPSSSRVHKEMTHFIQWFNESSESILAKAAIAHVYFESIHPFEDGNGRIGRVLVEKALSQSLGQSTLLAISQVIIARKSEYYAKLGACNKTLAIESWIKFFAEVILEAQEKSISLIEFLIAKAEMMNRLTGKINTRQEKVLLRMFSEGPKGFYGGLSAENYISITKTSKATATRDLTDLVEKGVLVKTGRLRHTRYRLNI